MEIEKQDQQLYADTANQTLTLRYWKIGVRINNDLLDGKRAEYGKQIVSQAATQLQLTFGKRGFEERNIRGMMGFSPVIWPDFDLVQRSVALNPCGTNWEKQLVQALPDDLKASLPSIEEIEKELENDEI